MRIKNLDLLNGTTPTLSANFASDPIYLGHVGMYSIQATFSGTPDGSFKLQCSNDFADKESINVESYAPYIINWSDVGSSTQLITAAGDIMYNVENVGYAWVRLVWEFSASTGTLETARVMTKGF